MVSGISLADFPGSSWPALRILKFISSAVQLDAMFIYRMREELLEMLRRLRFVRQQLAPRKHLLPLPKIILFQIQRATEFT
jgi:hypothetical protein